MVSGRSWAYCMLCNTKTHPYHTIWCSLGDITCGTSNCSSHSILLDLPKWSFLCLVVMSVMGHLQEETVGTGNRPALVSTSLN